MMCLLLNNGYDIERCFTCNHDNSLSMKCVEEEGIPFCEFMSLSYLMHQSGCVVHILLHYGSHVHIFSQFKLTLEKQKEWPDICDVLGKVIYWQDYMFKYNAFTIPNAPFTWSISHSKCLLFCLFPFA
uniref:Uncharacterized protein n=1 Tax=Oncorhynchus mykiss TaxID=8022 RepID=A0A8C7UJR1_ONCMY